MEAIRYGDRPEVRARLFQVVENALDRDQLRELIEERALAHDSMDATKVRRIREDMERIEARRLQPHFIASFFLEAFKELGGTIREREPRRYEITHVPAVLRHATARPASATRCWSATSASRSRSISSPSPASRWPSSSAPAIRCSDACPMSRWSATATCSSAARCSWTTRDDAPGPRALLCLEHAIQDARTDRAGNRRVVSRQMQFVEIDPQGQCRPAGYAPYLDYRPLKDEELPALQQLLREPWLSQQLESSATSYAIAQLLPRHIMEVRDHRTELIGRTRAAVQERLTKEINYWDHRAQQLRLEESSGTHECPAQFRHGPAPRR